MNASYGLVRLADMLALPISKLLAATNRISSTAQMFSLCVGENKAAGITKCEHADFAASVGDFAVACREIGFAVTGEIATDLMAEWRHARAEGENLIFADGNLHRTHGHMVALLRVLSSEAKTKVAMVLPAEKVALYEPKELLWGADVRSKFPSATKDIDEAAKCLAFGRSTAAVFHSMRVMEIALKAVRQCLGVSASGRNWGDALKDIRDERAKRGLVKWAKNDFFQDVYGRLDAIKDAWRNTTMHVENVYTEEDAARIFDYTKGFMEKIASHMDENGLPRA
jgi:hypothetical protein